MSVTKARDLATSLFGTFRFNNIFTAESISKSIFLSFFEGPTTIVISPFKVSEISFFKVLIVPLYIVSNF